MYQVGRAPFEEELVADLLMIESLVTFAANTVLLSPLMDLNNHWVVGGPTSSSCTIRLLRIRTLRLWGWLPLVI